MSRVVVVVDVVFKVDVYFLAQVILSHWPISKKIHMANQIINSEITETYKLVMVSATMGRLYERVAREFAVAIFFS